MGLLSNIAEIVQDLLIFVAVMMALLVLFVIMVSMMPNDNPLKRVLTALTYRLGATVLAGLVAIPIEPIPFIDALYDFGVPIALIWYWFTFLRDAGGLMRSPHWLPHGPPPFHSIKQNNDRSGRGAPDLRRDQR
jgi:hypothetical protein